MRTAVRICALRSLVVRSLGGTASREPVNRATIVNSRQSNELREVLMAVKEDMQRINERLAKQINEHARRDSSSPYAGKLVGIAHGQVVVVADSWSNVVDRLRQIEPDPAQCYCIDASADYDRVDEIWGVV
jgi:hypothetical protein